MTDSGIHILGGILKAMVRTDLVVDVVLYLCHVFILLLDTLRFSLSRSVLLISCTSKQRLHNMY